MTADQPVQTKSNPIENEAESTLEKNFLALISAEEKKNRSHKNHVITTIRQTIRTMNPLH